MENKFFEKKIELPDQVRTIISVLEQSGYEAYAVGGCVRDSLLGRTPGDWDITTSALPEQIKTCFHRTVDTGIEHGTVTVMIGQGAYEVTTYRIDGEYKDLRHPSGVSFTKAVSEDLRRRDFTINAMAYNDRTGILDLYGGREDLRQRMIRCVGKADERFDEDALRILRAVRFAAQLHFEIAPDTMRAIRGHARNLKAVSRERVLVEISKLICSAHMEKLEDVMLLELAPYISEYFNEIDLEHVKKLCEAAHRRAEEKKQAAEENEESSPELPAAFDLAKAVPVRKRYIRFAFAFMGMDPKKADTILHNLKADNETRKNAVLLSQFSTKPLPKDRYELKKIMSGIQPELFRDLLDLKQAALPAGGCEGEDLKAVRELFEDIMEKQEPVYLKDLCMSGSDLIACGVKEGPQLGALLKHLLDVVQRNPDRNTPEVLKSFL